MKPPDKEELLKDPVRILFERYHRALVRYFQRLGFSQEEARDLAQEVFVRVCQSVQSFRGEGAWSFLLTTARRIAINEIRRRSAGIRSGEDVSLDADPSLAESQAGSFPTPENDLIEREEGERQISQTRWLRKAIEGLPDSNRSCLLLWLGGLKYREIQKLEGISMNTVKGRLNEARNLLRKRLKEEPEGLDWPEVTPEVNRDQEI